MDDENEVVVPETTEEELTPEVTESQEETEVEQEVDWKAKAEEEAQARIKAEELANNQKVRAEKAEKKAKETVKESKSALSYKDTIALTKANVHEDDVDELIEMAAFKKMPLTDFLKTGLAKTILSDSSEKRETAEATTVGRARSGSASNTGESLLNKARQKGEMPDSDEDLNKLLDARYKKS